jgi:hypothetical protein
MNVCPPVHHTTDTNNLILQFEELLFGSNDIVLNKSVLVVPTYVVSILTSYENLQKIEFVLGQGTAFIK